MSNLYNMLADIALGALITFIAVMLFGVLPITSLIEAHEDAMMCAQWEKQHGHNYCEE